MNQQDRKRAFSKAFQPAPHDFGDAFRQAARSVTALSVTSTPSSFYTPSTSFNPNKENVAPFFQGKGRTPVAPGPPLSGYYQHQGLAPLTVTTLKDSPLRGHPLQDLSNMQCNGSGISSQLLPSSIQSPTLGYPGVSSFTLPTPPAEQNQLLLSFSPLDFNFECRSPLDEVLGACVDSEPGLVVHEDPDTTKCGQHCPAIPAPPLTPSELNLQDLSLLDVPQRPSLALASRPVAQYKRTSVYVVHSAIFDGCFPEILPNEVVVAFDRGKQVMKVDKYPICNESRFFAQMLDGPFLDAHTRCIRLRDDFPFAITAMLQFIETSIYIFDPSMRIKHPHITLLDLHIHAYLAGSKYDVPKLCDHAIAEYINIGQMILSLGVTFDYSGLEDDGPEMSLATFPATFNDPEAKSGYPAPRDPNDSSPAAVTDRFLDSLVLLWKNTPNHHDTMRAAVLELIKPELNKLMRLRFFVTMMLELVPFGDDILHSLAEDGLDVKAFPVPVGMRQKWVVRFGGL